MKSIKQKTTPEPIKVEEPVVKVENLTIEKCGQTLCEMGNCLTRHIEKFRSDYTQKDKEAQPAQGNLSNLYELKNHMSLIVTFLNPNFLALVDECIAYYTRLVEKEKESANKNENKMSRNAIRQNIRRNKVTINGRTMTFGELIGNIVEHLKNKDGNRMIEVEDHKLAQMLSLGCVLIGGKPLNVDTLAISIGKGRKLKSIIDQVVLDAFYKKEE